MGVSQIASEAAFIYLALSIQGQEKACLNKVFSRVKTILIVTAIGGKALTITAFISVIRFQISYYITCRVLEHMLCVGILLYAQCVRASRSF